MWLMPAVSKTISTCCGDDPQVTLQIVLVPHEKLGFGMKASAMLAGTGCVAESFGVQVAPATVSGWSVAVPEYM